MDQATFDRSRWCFADHDDDDFIIPCVAKERKRHGSETRYRPPRNDRQSRATAVAKRSSGRDTPYLNIIIDPPRKSLLQAWARTRGHDLWGYERDELLTLRAFRSLSLSLDVSFFDEPAPLPLLRGAAAVVSFLLKNDGNGSREIVRACRESASGVWETRGIEILGWKSKKMGFVKKPREDLRFPLYYSLRFLLLMQPWKWCDRILYEKNSIKTIFVR